MTLAQFNALKIGDRVIMLGRTTYCGTVTEATANWIIIQWDNGVTDACRKKATVEVEYWCRNLDVFPEKGKVATEGKKERRSRK